MGACSSINEEELSKQGKNQLDEMRGLIEKIDEIYKGRDESDGNKVSEELFNKAESLTLEVFGIFSEMTLEDQKVVLTPEVQAQIRKYLTLSKENATGDFVTLGEQALPDAADETFESKVDAMIATVSPDPCAEMPANANINQLDSAGTGDNQSPGTDAEPLVTWARSMQCQKNPDGTYVLDPSQRAAIGDTMDLLTNSDGTTGSNPMAAFQGLINSFMSPGGASGSSSSPSSDPMAGFQGLINSFMSPGGTAVGTNPMDFVASLMGGVTASPDGTQPGPDLAALMGLMTPGGASGTNADSLADFMGNLDGYLSGIGGNTYGIDAKSILDSLLSLTFDMLGLGNNILEVMDSAVNPGDKKPLQSLVSTVVTKVQENAGCSDDDTTMPPVVDDPNVQSASDGEGFDGVVQSIVGIIANPADKENFEEMMAAIKPTIDFDNLWCSDWETTIDVGMETLCPASLSTALEPSVAPVTDATCAMWEADDYDGMIAAISDLDLEQAFGGDGLSTMLTMFGQ